MQLRRLAALERQKIIDDHDELEAHDRRLQRHPRHARAPARRSSPRSSPRSSRSTATSGAPRSCRSTATCRWRTSSPRRTSSSRSPAAATPSAPGSTTTARSGAAARACAAPQLRGDDVVEHFFTTTTHHWLLFFTNLGRVYRAKAYELPEGGRDAKGQHVANLHGVPAGRADRPGARPSATTRRPPTSCSPPARAWSRRPGSAEYDSNRTGGLIAVNLREGDELVGAGLASSRRRPAARLAQGPVGALPRRRRRAAADGPGDLAASPA